jgi:hypothetical protein
MLTVYAQQHHRLLTKSGFSESPRRSSHASGQASFQIRERDEYDLPFVVHREPHADRLRSTAQDSCLANAGGIRLRARFEGVLRLASYRYRFTPIVPSPRGRHAPGDSPPPTPDPSPYLPTPNKSSASQHTPRTDLPIREDTTMIEAENEVNPSTLPCCWEVYGSTTSLPSFRSRSASNSLLRVIIAASLAFTCTRERVA